MANIIDSYSESNQNTSTLVSNVTGVGQSFTGNGSKVGSAQFYLQKSSSPTGNVVAKIYAHSGTFGTSSVPTGTALATSDTVDVTTVPASFGLVTFNFSGANQITLTNGTHYVVTVEYTTNGFPNGFSVGYDNTSPTHGGNYSENFSGWSATAGSDTCFYVYDNAASSPTINVFDSSAVTEAVTMLEKHNVNVFDSSSVTENIVMGKDPAIINIFDSSAVTESETTIQIFNATGVQEHWGIRLWTP